MKNKINEKQIKVSLLCVGMVIIGIGIGLVVNRPKTIPVLENGEEVVAKIDDKDFTADELYLKLKDKGGSTILLNLIDQYIAGLEIEDTTEAMEYGKSYLANIKAQYKTQNYDFEEALKNAGYADEDSFVKDVADDYILKLAAEKYIKANLISEDEIKSYYNTDIFGQMHVRYILITPEKTEDMTDEQIEEAETKALAEANEVIAKLKNGDDFAKLAKEYSDDASTASEGGLYDGFVKSDVVEEFWNASVALEDGKYTTSPVESSYGYFVISRIKQDEKPEIKDVKDEILENILSQKETDDENLISKTWIEMRKNYNLNIIDSDMNEAYNDLKKSN